MRRKNFTIRRQRAALECPTFPFNPREFRAPDMLCRDSGLPLNTRNSTGTAGNVFEDLPAPEGSSPLFFKIPRNLTSSPFELRSGNTGSTMRHGEGLRREPQSSTRPTPRFTRNFKCLESNAPYWRNFFSKLYDGSSEVCFLGVAFRNIPRFQVTFNVGESTSRPKCVCEHTVPSDHNVVDQ